MLKPPLSDTSPETEKVWIELWRQKTPEWRLQRMLGLTADVRNRAYAGVRQARPELSSAELNAFYFELLYGRKLADAVRDRLPRS